MFFLCSIKIMCKTVDQIRTNCKRWRTVVEGKVRARNSTGAGCQEELSDFEKMLERIFCQKTLLSSALKVHSEQSTVFENYCRISHLGYIIFADPLSNSFVKFVKM